MGKAMDSRRLSPQPRGLQSSFFQLDAQYIDKGSPNENACAGRAAQSSVPGKSSGLYRRRTYLKQARGYRLRDIELQPEDRGGLSNAPYRISFRGRSSYGQ